MNIQANPNHSAVPHSRITSTPQSQLAATHKDPTGGVSIYAQNVKRIYADLAPAHQLPQIDHNPLPVREFENSPQDIQNYRARMLQQGNRKDTDVIFRLDGNIIASLSESGAGEMTNSVAQALRDVPSNLASIERALKSKYGDSLQVETFPQGGGPSQAELFEMRNGRSLHAYINETSRQMKASFHATQYQLQQDKAEKQKLDTVEQSTTFTINDKVIGSLGKDGTININHAILSTEMDKSGVDKEIGQQLLALGKITNKSDDVSDILRKGFGGNSMQVAEFPPSKGPTLEELANAMSAQQATQIRYSA